MRLPSPFDGPPVGPGSYAGDAAARHPILFFRYRVALGTFIIGLVLSGITAFPLMTEMDLLVRWLGIEGVNPLDRPALSGLNQWILIVHDGLRDSYTAHPWLGYGTDWLAFGHIVIALFFVGPWRDPILNAWVLRVGMLACLGVFPLAMICGAIREVPFYWRLIDCSFGVGGMLLLMHCQRLGNMMRR